MEDVNPKQVPVAGQQIAEPKKKRKRYSKKACAHCKRAHSACSDERPCKRCKEKGLECFDAEENQQQPQTPQQPAAHEHSHHKNPKKAAPKRSFSSIQTPQQISQQTPVQTPQQIPSSPAIPSLPPHLSQLLASYNNQSSLDILQTIQQTPANNNQEMNLDVDNFLNFEALSPSTNNTATGGNLFPDVEQFFGVNLNSLSYQSPQPMISASPSYDPLQLVSLEEEANSFEALRQPSPSPVVASNPTPLAQSNSSLQRAQTPTLLESLMNNNSGLSNSVNYNAVQKFQQQQQPRINSSVSSLINQSTNVINLGGNGSMPRVQITMEDLVKQLLEKQSMYERVVQENQFLRNILKTKEEKEKAELELKLKQQTQQQAVQPAPSQDPVIFGKTPTSAPLFWKSTIQFASSAISVWDKRTLTLIGCNSTFSQMVECTMEELTHDFSIFSFCPKSAVPHCKIFLLTLANSKAKMVQLKILWTLKSGRKITLQTKFHLEDTFFWCEQQETQSCDDEFFIDNIHHKKTYEVKCSMSSPAHNPQVAPLHHERISTFLEFLNKVEAEKDRLNMATTTPPSQNNASPSTDKQAETVTF